MKEVQRDDDDQDLKWHRKRFTMGILREHKQKGRPKTGGKKQGVRSLWDVRNKGRPTRSWTKSVGKLLLDDIAAGRWTAEEQRL